MLQMIYLLCDALKEFDYSSTAHFEAGYHCSAPGSFDIDFSSPFLILCVVCRFNHLSVLAKLCEENGVAVPAYQNAIVNALRIGRKDSAYNMFLPSKVFLLFFVGALKPQVTSSNQLSIQPSPGVR